jgi:hypothetical protein
MIAAVAHHARGHDDAPGGIESLDHPLDELRVAGAVVVDHHDRLALCLGGAQVHRAREPGVLLESDRSGVAVPRACPRGDRPRRSVVDDDHLVLHRLAVEGREQIPQPVGPVDGRHDHGRRPQGAKIFSRHQCRGR